MKIKKDEKDTVYIFPGLEETTRRKVYQDLRRDLERLGCTVKLKNLDWRKKFSKQIFPIEDEAILIGFSLGAIFAKLLAESVKPKKVLLLSATEMKYFKNKKDIKTLAKVWSKPQVLDLVKNLHHKTKLKNEVYFYGDQEKVAGDIIIKNTGHELTANYLQAIKKFLTYL